MKAAHGFSLHFNTNWTDGRGGGFHFCMKHHSVVAACQNCLGEVISNIYQQHMFIWRRTKNKNKECCLRCILKYHMGWSREKVPLDMWDQQRL